MEKLLHICSKNFSRFSIRQEIGNIHIPMDRSRSGKDGRSSREGRPWKES